MGLDFAIDALYESGWHPALNSSLSASPTTAANLRHHPDGRVYPTEDAIRKAFADQGLTLAIRHVQLFDCHRAEWNDNQGQPLGAVVGQSAAEAAVYALSQLRKHAPLAKA